MPHQTRKAKKTMGCFLSIEIAAADGVCLRAEADDCRQAGATKLEDISKPKSGELLMHLPPNALNPEGRLERRRQAARCRP